jgi:hypothetical protein
MTNAQEKRVNRIAEHKGFRLEKAGHGKGHGRFYIMSVAEGGRIRSDVLDHEYSFSLGEAEAWLATRNDSASRALSGLPCRSPLTTQAAVHPVDLSNRRAKLHTKQ